MLSALTTKEGRSDTEYAGAVMDLHSLPFVALESRLKERASFRCDLPNSNAMLVEFGREMDAVVGAMCPDERFECPLDGVVAAVYPRLRPHIEAFYAGRGPCLAALTDQKARLLLDKKIALRIRACALIVRHLSESSGVFPLEEVLRSAILEAGG